MKSATPEGVPVMMTVPALSVLPRLKCSMICPTLHIMSLVFVFCLTSPFTFVVYSSCWQSPRTPGAVMAGPIGAK